MECNKDEAVRAREIAEKKMGNNDFEGARKIALKAQNLYPELENISQLLSICDVHCAAQTRIFAAEKDWYGILRVAKFADESTVRKQYRRLALYLHPDKNRFPGAEAAFKLICEANAVLSDSTKKSIYDSKIRVTVRSAPVIPPPHTMNKTYQFNKQYGVQNNVPNGLGSLNQHQATQSGFSIRQEMFVTSCPFCSVKHQHPRTLLNMMVNCQHCLKNFIGYDLGVAQGIPVGPKWVPPTAHTVPVRPGLSQSAGFQATAASNPGKFPMGVKSGVGSSVSQEASQWRASRKTVEPKPGVPKSRSAAEVSGDTKGKEADNCNVNPSHGQKEGTACNRDANSRETGHLRNKSKKKGRKRVVESSESCDTSSDSDIEDVTIKNDWKSGPSHTHLVRRSSRKRQNVSYAERNDDDDDDVLPSPLKTSDGNKVSECIGNEQKDALGGEQHSKHESQNGTVHPEESVRAKDVDFDQKVKGKGKSDDLSGDGADAIVNESDSDSDAAKDICNCEDPEFSDFDKDRDESNFSANQFWACYDTADGMPRFYAKVKKVSASPFGLSLTWLEADPMDEAHMKWLNADLPVGCGTFKLGEHGFSSSHITFSHQVLFQKGKRGSLTIYPKVGEVWALFKDWDLNWSSNPENHRKYKYEIVEVLLDFVTVDGIKVCYLAKVTGFVSLFQRSSKNETNSFLIRPNELYKFSHLVPCYKMTGDERQGVPAGSFELDPASLPLNPDDLYYPGKAMMDSGKLGHGAN
ncbi:hypothetical protein OROGR_018508 [Orobanche gracilis]